MHKQIWLRTFVALAMLMVGLPGHSAAQTPERNTPINVRYSTVQNSMVAAKAAAALAARSRGVMLLRSAQPAGSFTTFDAPGAVDGTYPQAVSALGVIAGYYNDANRLSHGFLRVPNGALMTFDVPGALYGTYPGGLNDQGSIVGTYYDNVGSGEHSFLRNPDGMIATFDPPVQNSGSGAAAINPDGTILGYYFDASFLQHGFLRTRDGKFATFDAPGAAGFYGTNPLSITPDGSILGFYSINSSAKSITGFLLSANGRFMQITGPGGLEGQLDPYNPGPALSINRLGEIAGTYFAPISGNPFGGNYRAFVRSRDGRYVAFDAATYSPCCIWTATSGLNSAGTVTGSFNDGYSVNHGFWRTCNGTVTTFDVPGAGTGFNEGTLPIGIAADGVIAGEYRDATLGTHGFVFRPHKNGW